MENEECGECGVWKMRSVENTECGKCIDNFSHWIIHQAVHVFLLHTLKHFKHTRKTFLSKQNPPIRHFRHSNHQQQQEHGTQVCRRIRITSWPCQQMLKSATDALTCSQKNFVSHHTTSWSSTWIGVWYEGTTTQGR